MNSAIESRRGFLRRFGCPVWEGLGRHGNVEERAELLPPLAAAHIEDEQVLGGVLGGSAVAHDLGDGAALLAHLVS